MLEENFLGNEGSLGPSRESGHRGSVTQRYSYAGVFIGQLDSVSSPQTVEILLEEIQRDSRLGVVYGSFRP